MRCGNWTCEQRKAGTLGQSEINRAGRALHDASAISNAVGQCATGFWKGPPFFRLLRNSVDHPKINEKMPGESEGIFLWAMCRAKAGAKQPSFRSPWKS